MTDWPDDWFRDGGSSPDPAVQPRTPQGSGSAGQVGNVTEADKLTQPRHGQAAWQGAQGPAQLGGAPAGGWPEQPALRTAGRPARTAPAGAGGGSYAGGGAGGSGWRRWLRPRRVLTVIAVLLCLAIVGSVATYFYLDSMLTKKNVLVDYSGRPTPGAGTNWLITGSDSRQGLTRAQERKYATGRGISGQRSDTIMVLHLPANGGKPVLVSLPRDSWVNIPGHGYAKINAAYSIGGPKLLAETVQNITGLYINHYMGIGFGGFVRVVNAVGGVRICLDKPLVDPASGLHLKAGCQVLDGGEALGYVRTRHQFATQDLQRVQDQRAFLRALLRKLTSAGVLADPFKSFPAASGVAGSLTVDKGTSLYQLIHIAFALRNPITTTVPIANANYVIDGQDALQWNRAQALQLFNDLRTDQKVPKSLISGSTTGG
jgi:LCP family protein required for cell wall assembly